MKRFALAAMLLTMLCSTSFGRHPLRPWLDSSSPCADGQCGRPSATVTALPPIAAIPALPSAISDDQADMAEAVARGLGSRLAIWTCREATLAIRAWRSEPIPAGETDGGLARLQGHLGRTPRFTACQKATMAVIALEMVNSFSPGTIPPQVLVLAEQIQAAACGTPVPPTPTPTPVPVPVPTPVPVPPAK
jgi:hypothetical protein